LPVELPEGLVDPSVFAENRAGAGKTEVAKALAESAALGAIEIEEGAVEVEKDGAGARQGGVTSPGR
jgi:AAA+ superfamily predicted ATPase